MVISQDLNLLGEHRGNCYGGPRGRLPCLQMPHPLWILAPSLPCGHLIVSLITGVDTLWEIPSLLGLAMAFSSVGTRINTANSAEEAVGQEDLLPHPSSSQGFGQLLGYKIVFVGYQVRTVVGNHISVIFGV